MLRRAFFTLPVAALGQQAKRSPPTSQGTPWTQWGGPNRNFQTEAKGLREQLPSRGPAVLWKRPLGEGYSSPCVEDGVLYTMYGKPGQEVVLAASATTGKTLWERATPVSFHSSAPEMGNGPYATPLVLQDRVIATGVTGLLQALDKKTGKLLWQQQLWTEHKGSRLTYGYASSPLGFRDTVIVPVGGKGRALMAFRTADGSVAWSKGDLGNAYSSPILIHVDGLEQVAAVLNGTVVGVNPHNGDPQWKFPFEADYGIIVATPVYGPGNLLFVSAEYGAGAKVVQLQRSGDQTKLKELWTSNRLRLHHGNAIAIDGTLYFSSGGKGSVAVMTAADFQTGRIHWQERSVPKASFVWADNKLITLDQDGMLMLARPSPQGFKILTKAELLTRISWTPPVLVGTHLYIRDRNTLMAVDLG